MKRTLSRFAPRNSWRILVCGALAVALSACFESSSEQPPPKIGDSGNTTDIFANDDSLNIAPDTSGSVDIFRNDRPTDGFSLQSFDSVSVKQGSVTETAPGILGYTPPSGFSGNDQFSYTIVDSHNHIATATVNVRVDVQVISEGKAYYQKQCAICHAAGSDDTSRAFLASDLRLSESPLQPDLTDYGGEFKLMGSFYDVAQDKIDGLKAYILTLKANP